MDPTGLASAAVSMLLPVLKQAGGRMAGEAAERLSALAVTRMESLHAAIKSRVSGEPYAAALLQGVEEAPDAVNRQRALAAALKDVISTDEAFEKKLRALVASVNEAAGHQIQATDAGVVAGGDVHQSGHYVAGRDLHIGGEGTGTRTSPQ